MRIRWRVSGKDWTNYADYVTLTRDEYAKLCTEYGEEAAKAMIDILNNYKGCLLYTSFGLKPKAVKDG